MIAAIPPHWNEGVKMAHGTRWAGAVRENSNIIIISQHRSCFIICISHHTSSSIYLIMYDTMLHHIAWHYTFSCHDIARCIIPYHITWHHTAPYFTTSYNIPNHITLHHTIVYHTILYHTTQHHIILHTHHFTHLSNEHNTLVLLKTKLYQTATRQCHTK